MSEHKIIEIKDEDLEGLDAQGIEKHLHGLDHFEQLMGSPVPKDTFHTILNSTKQMTKPMLLGSLAMAYVAPLETRLASGRIKVSEGKGTPEDWDYVASIYEQLAFGRAAQMFRNAATEMRVHGKRYKLTYPDNKEHIVEIE